MAKNNMNAITNDVNVAASVIDTTGNDRLFTKYIDTNVAAEQAAYSLRDSICKIVIRNTALETRVDENFYNMLIQEAEVFCCKKTIKLYKDDRYVTTYTFIGDIQQILVEIERFFSEVIICYHCYYEDRISYGDKEGFCWNYNGMKIAIV